MQITAQACVKPVIVLFAIAGASLALFFGRVNTSDGTTPINKAWQSQYVVGNENQAFRFRAERAECRVCHVIIPKGSIEGLNGYGNAVKKFVVKSELNELESDQEKLKKYINDGLKRAGLERNSSGKSFQELFDEGSRPWEEPD